MLPFITFHAPAFVGGGVDSYSGPGPSLAGFGSEELISSASGRISWRISGVEILFWSFPSVAIMDLLVAMVSKWVTQSLFAILWSTPDKTNSRVLG